MFDSLFLALFLFYAMNPDVLSPSLISTITQLAALVFAAGMVLQRLKSIEEKLGKGETLFYRLEAVDDEHAKSIANHETRIVVLERVDTMRGTVPATGGHP